MCPGMPGSARSSTGGASHAIRGASHPPCSAPSPPFPIPFPISPPASNRCVLPPSTRTLGDGQLGIRRAQNVQLSIDQRALAGGCDSTVASQESNARATRVPSVPPAIASRKCPSLVLDAFGGHRPPCCFRPLALPDRANGFSTSVNSRSRQRRTPCLSPRAMLPAPACLYCGTNKQLLAPVALRDGWPRTSTRQRFIRRPRPFHLPPAAGIASLPAPPHCY